MELTETISPPVTRPKKLWPKLFRLTGLLIFLGSVGFWWTHRTYHFETVQDGVLYRSGNRGAAELTNAIRTSHIRTVVSLIDDNELNNPKKPQFQDETRALKDQSVTLLRIPVKLGGWPADTDLKQFFAIVADPTKQPVLVHCAQGVRRTGMFVAAYEESVLGYDKEKAKQSILTFGHSDNTIGDITKFIDSYDPKTVAWATTMPATSNE